MPLYTLSNHDADGAADLTGLTVRATDEDKAREHAAKYLLGKGLYEDVARFTDPARVTIEQVKVQGQSGVLDVSYGQQ